MKKIIISGVTGQDGSYMVDYLLTNTDYQLFGVVRHTSGVNYKNLEHNLKNPRLEIVKADLTDLISLSYLVDKIKPDYFINFAAQSFVAESWNSPVNTFEVNALGVLYCLEAIRKHAPKCRFYSAGTSEEVGDVDYSPQDMNHPLKPRSPYGASKAAAKHLVKVYRESYNMYAIHGRLYNHESPRRGEMFVTRKISKGVARIKKAIEKGEDFEPIELGNLDSKRDWSHALDFCDGIWRMLNQDKWRDSCFREIIETRINHDSQGHLISFPETFIQNEVVLENIKEYILSSDETHSIRDFIEYAFKNIIHIERADNGEAEPTSDPKGRQIQYTYSNYDIKNKPIVVINPKFYRPAEVDILQGDSSLTRKELGWKPKISFEQLVEEMVNYDYNLINGSYSS